jgi:adenylate kinase
MQDIIIITGVPGTGKTTVSRLLSEHLDGVHVDLTALVQHEELYTGFDEDRQTLIIDLEKLAHRILNMTAGDGFLILDGHVAPQVAPTDRVNLVFVLRRAPWELEKVLEGRGWSKDKVGENVDAELVDVALVDALDHIDRDRIYEINVTAKTPEKLVSEMVDTLEGDRTSNVGVVDWLADERARRYLR